MIILGLLAAVVALFVFAQAPPDAFESWCGGNPQPKKEKR